MTREERIEDIIMREWDMFQHVNNEGGRASCQDDWPTFNIMRESQYACWPDGLLAGMQQELIRAGAQERNLVMEKYARMMASTAPEQYARMEPVLPRIPEVCRQLTEEIVSVHCRWMQEHAEQYPSLSSRGRVLYTSQDSEWETSAETYLRGELLTWSEELLRGYLAFVKSCEETGVNLVIEQDRHMVAAYGYDSLEEAEERYS